VAARRARVSFGLAAALLASSRVARAADTNVRPLPVEAALRQAEITQRIPIQFSPDGRRIAYTVQYPDRIEPTGDSRSQAMPATSAGPEALGCDLWVADVATGEAKNVSEGHGTSWGPAWSPDGRLLAFFSDRDGLARVWVWDAATAEVRRVSDAVVRTYFNFEVALWSRDGKILAKILPEGLTLDQIRERAFGKAKTAEPPKKGASTVVVYRSGVSDEAAASVPAAAEKPGYVQVNRADLALLDPATGTVRRIATEVRPRGYWFSPDGAEVAFTDITGWAENTQQPQYDLYAVRLSDGSRRVLGRQLNMAYGISVSWSPDGKSLAYVRSGQLTKDQVVVISAADGRETTVAETPHIDADWQDTPPLWDPQGKSVFVLGEKALARVAVGAKESKPVFETPDGDTLCVPARPETGRYWSPDGGRSLYVVFRDGTTKKTGAARVDLASGKSRPLFSEEAFIGRGPFTLDVSPDGKWIAFGRQDATHPEDLWVAGVDFAQPRRLTRVNPQLDGYVYGKTQLVDWKAGDTALRGALLLPAGYEAGKRYPMIVNVYGGSSRSNSLFRFGLSGAGVEDMQIFATRGYAMLLPDTPIDREKHSPMSEIARTVLPGVDRVVALGIADADRLGVMGHSYGGYSTLSIVVQTTRFKAAMASASMSNLISMYGEFENGESGGIGYLEKGQGDMGDTPWKARDRYVANSPFFFLDRVETPVLLVHGGLDVPENAEQTFVGLRRLGKPVELAIYEGEQHWEGTWGFFNQVDYWNRMLRWFGKYLGGTE